jgi:hypothetical protein
MCNRPDFLLIHGIVAGSYVHTDSLISPGGPDGMALASAGRHGHSRSRKPRACVVGGQNGAASVAQGVVALICPRRRRDDDLVASIAASESHRPAMKSAAVATCSEWEGDQLFKLQPMHDGRITAAFLENTPCTESNSTSLVVVMPARIYISVVLMSAVSWWR